MCLAAAQLRFANLLPPTYSTTGVVESCMRVKMMRLPRHRRVTNPPSMHLTARDMGVILAVRDCRVLRRDQIQRLYFPSQNTANYRLQRLYQHGFLERRWRPVEFGEGTGQALYLLGRRAIELLAQRAIGVERLTRRRGASHTLRSPFLQHTLAVNDVRVAFSLCAQHKGYGIEKWVTEDGLKAGTEYIYSGITYGTSHQGAIIADAYFVMHLGDRRAHFLLEVDRATETSRRWVRRVGAYLAFTASGEYTRRFGTTSLRILVVTTTSQRLLNLKRATEQAGASSLFWFTTLELVRADTVVTGAIWRVAGHAGVTALVSRTLLHKQTVELDVVHACP
jgi:hypothetical protein